MSTRGLREALKAMPKALTEGEQLGQLRTDVSAANARANLREDAREATQTGATGKVSPEAKRARVVKIRAPYMNRLGITVWKSRGFAF